MSELFYELWAARSSPDLLVVPYERLLSDLDGQIMRITRCAFLVMYMPWLRRFVPLTVTVCLIRRFFGFDDMTDEQRALVKSRCMRDFMLVHKDHFDGGWACAAAHVHTLHCSRRTLNE